MRTKKTKRRALYFYTCASCGKKRDSLIYIRALGEVCAKCRKSQVAENQPSLFPEENQAEVDTMVGEVLDEINNELTATRQKSTIRKERSKHKKPIKTEKI